MRSIHRATFLLGSILLASCATAPGETPNAPVASVSTGVVPATPPGAKPTAEPVAEPPPSAEPAASAVPTPPPTPVRGDLVDSPGDARLEPAALHLKAGENVKAKLALTRVLPDIDKTATVDVQMAAHALLGRACQSLDDAKCAQTNYQTVRALWKDPAQAAKTLDGLGGDDAAKSARLARSLNAVGEALFFAAEEKRAATDKEKFPAYTGSGARESVVKHVNTKVAAWVKARRILVEDAEKAYLAIVTVQPFPPPRWVVAAASRVGDMWGKFAAEFRSTPIPTEWKQSGPHPTIANLTWEEIREVYLETLVTASEPMLKTARGAYEKCQSFAQKFGIQDAYSKRCDEWLAKNPNPGTPP